ncbi:SRPBCC family protein [Mycolicibacterium mengxianglii]|uniref:SRPBCC family protein n=1 Tax=Mycolicibacterium mengxianglii TaxID=2736649 RepID=UPI0018EF0F6E|nr:SRPBCC family protein [Mycolicibacterium mengxianglii]
MAIRASREIVIEAPPAEILAALADVESIPDWSAVHKRAEVIDRYDDGRPHHVRVAVRVLGLVDEEILEYHWGPNSLVWDAGRTSQQYAQHVEYTLKPEPLTDTTRVRVDITVEPAAPLPHFLVKRASKTVLDSATRGLRGRVLARQGSPGR